jgi:hypothetical protein
MEDELDKIEVDHLKKFNEDLHINSKEIDYLKSQLEDLLSNFEIKLKEFTTELNQEIKHLKSENLFLNKLLVKIGEKLDLMIPYIAREIKTQTLSEFEYAIKYSTEQINELGRKIESSTNQIYLKEQIIFRNRMLVFGLSVICSSLISVSICYFLIRNGLIT